MRQNQKHFLVCGGTGSIGRSIVNHLVAQDIFVDTISRGKTNPDICEGTRAVSGHTMIRDSRCDVTSERSVETCFLKSFVRQDPLDGIVYCVGHCPPGGFDKAIDVPLSSMALDYFQEEYQRQLIGLFNVVTRFKSHIKQDGHVVVIGSAITRVTVDICPPFLRAGQYAIAKAAQHEFVRWYRRDESIKASRIRVHYLAPIAVDTLFHQDCEHVPPAMIPIDTVAEEVVKCLDSGVSVDKMIVSPSRPT